MLYTKIDETKRVAVLEADGPLTKADFERSGAIFSNYTQANGRLRGLIIYTEKFPGWGSAKDLPYHFKYASSHKNKAERVAFVTNSQWSIWVKLFGHILTGTTTNVFRYDDFSSAEKWVLSD